MDSDLALRGNGMLPLGVDSGDLGVTQDLASSPSPVPSHNATCFSPPVPFNVGLLLSVSSSSPLAACLAALDPLHMEEYPTIPLLGQELQWT